MWQPLCALNQLPAVQIQTLRLQFVMESRSHKGVQRARAANKYRPRAA